MVDGVFEFGSVGSRVAAVTTGGRFADSTGRLDALRSHSLSLCYVRRRCVLRSMCAEAFWSSAEGQAIAWWYRHLRTRRLYLQGEPLKHGNRADKSRRADDFAQGVAQLTKVRQGALTGPVALDLDFHTSADQPPHLYHLAKRYLDLLGAAPPQAPAGGRRHMLYRDDRQVRLLHVRTWQPSGRHHQTAYNRTPPFWRDHCEMLLPTWSSPTPCAISLTITTRSHPFTYPTCRTLTSLLRSTSGLPPDRQSGRAAEMVRLEHVVAAA